MYDDKMFIMGKDGRLRLFSVVSIIKTPLFGIFQSVNGKRRLLLNETNMGNYAQNLTLPDSPFLPESEPLTIPDVVAEVVSVDFEVLVLVVQGGGVHDVVRVSDHVGDLAGLVFG